MRCRALVLVAVLSALSAGQTKLLRFPDVCRDRVAFCYAGDIWIAPAAGGAATRLTSHEGLELFPKFSPDGQWIAFTGQYEGDEQVYVVPSTGGVPRQLSWYPARGPLPPRWGYDNQVYGWTRDGSAVLFRSMRDGFALTDTRLYTVPLGGGLPVALPMPVSGGGDLSPDGTKAVYSPLTRDFRTWKRYQGGWAQDLYIYDFATAALTPVAPHVRTERDPMWIGGQVWFASDRDGTLNLYVYDVASGAVEQVTRSTVWDVRWPSRDEEGQIVFEMNGELQLLDTRTRNLRPVAITVPSEGLSMRPSWIKAAERVEDYGLSPKGERAVFTARGDVFTLPIEKGNARNLTHSPGAHDRYATWSPDGTRIAYISDATGEEELWLVAQDGSAPPEMLTSDGKGRRRQGPTWSPDNARIAVCDQKGRISVVTLATKQAVDVARDGEGSAGDYAWSPDGAHLAFSLGDPNGFRSLWIWSAGDGQLRRVTDEMFNEREPVWDPEGNWLWFLSDREFAPQLSTVEWNFSTNRNSGIFALALRKDVKHPFPPESDEVGDADKKKDAKPEGAPPKEDKDAKPAAEAGAKAEAKPPKPVVIDWDGLGSRVCRVPVPADNYSNLGANAKHLFWMRGGARYYGRESESKRRVEVFTLEDRKATVLVEDARNYTLSADGAKMIVREAGDYARYDAGPKAKESRKAIATGGLALERIPEAEWKQIFFEVWRRFRDFFYVENMHAYDWEALRDRYAQLLPAVAHRSDLNYVLGEMVAELNVSHAYIAGGDYEVPERPHVALPGARFELDAASGLYRISKIFAGQNEEEIYRSPLTEVGVDARPGDYVIAIDGIELRAPDNPYRLLRHKADRAVELLLNAAPTREGALKAVFKPIGTETELIYLEWIARNREYVSRATNGRVGYIHLPNMGAEGIREFIKWFYGQVRKEGLVVDVRGNGGGNVSSMILERLRRTLLGTEYSRNSEFAGTYPQVVFHGPMVCLLNENSASDGDIFPWMFREAKLGPLIGKRSWGGVVGITDRGPLIDGGTVNVPEFGHADARGQWAVEGWGVDPDIVVDNDPASVIAGKDPQLDRGIAELMKQLASPHLLPPRPAGPDKR